MLEPSNPNPLLPADYYLALFAWLTIMLATLVLLFIALLSIRKNRQELTSLQTLVWVLLVVLVPIIGSASWLIAGRPTHDTKTQQAGAAR